MTIDFASVPDFHDKDKKLVIFDLGKDAIRSNAPTPELPKLTLERAAKRLGVRRDPVPQKGADALLFDVAEPG